MIETVNSILELKGGGFIIAIVIFLSFDIFITYLIKERKPSLPNSYFKACIGLGYIQSTFVKVFIGLVAIFSIINQTPFNIWLLSPVFVYALFVIGMLFDYFRLKNCTDK